MTKAEKIEAYLIKNDIDYYKNEEGWISIDINKIPKDKFKAYHDYRYSLQ